MTDAPTVIDVMCLWLTLPLILLGITFSAGWALSAAVEAAARWLRRRIGSAR